MSRLGDRLRARIAAEGPITFAAFMEAALYDPDDGFYARGPRIGRGGAFATVPTLVPLFAEALAADLRARWRGARPPRSVHRSARSARRRDARRGPRRALADLPLELVLCERSEGLAALSARGCRGRAT